MRLKDTVLHRWLGVPHKLHVRLRRPQLSRKAPTLLFLHGIGNSGEDWQNVIQQLPPHYQAITIDLLGFGKSPKPVWANYSAKRQARAVIATYVRLRVRGKVVIVGHSLGALVAVEIAKRYPLLVRSLVLCSPPFYKTNSEKRRIFPNADTLLQDIYRHAGTHSEQFLKIATLAVRLGLTKKPFHLTPENIDIYMNALEASILNQTSLQDATKIHLPIHIVYGRLDPILISQNIRWLAKVNEQVDVSTVLAAHEIKGPYTQAVVKTITATMDKA